LDRARAYSPSDPHAVIRLGSPPLNEQFHFLAEPTPNPVFFGLPLPTPEQVAREAMKLARNGTVFLVTPATFEPDALLTHDPRSVISRFISAMEPRFQFVRRVTYPGDITPESVYVFRDTALRAERTR
jgi:hypothetical protein